LLFDSPENVLRQVQQLIDEGELKATLFNAPKTNEPSLRFNDASTNARSEAELFKTITQEVAKTKLLTEFVRLADSKIVMSKDHIVHMRRSREEQSKPGLPLSLAGSRFNTFGDSPMGAEDEENSMMVDDSELLGEEDDEEDLMEP
jgi:hypothetical protein